MKIDVLSGDLRQIEWQLEISFKTVEEIVQSQLLQKFQLNEVVVRICENNRQREEMRKVFNRCSPIFKLFFVFNL